MLLIAKITKPHGIKGEVRVESYCAKLENLKTYNTLYTVKGKKYKIENLKAIRQNLAVIKFAETATRQQAESLAGTQLYIPREALLPANADEFYISDLIGLQAFTRQQEFVGKIVQVCNFGAGDLLEIATPQQSRFIAFTAENVPEIDIAKNKIIIVPPIEV